MADVELILHVDNSDALAKIKQTQLAAAEMQKELTGKGDERVEFLKKELDTLTKISDAQKKAFDKDKVDDFTRSVGDSKDTMEEYGEETEKAEKKTTSLAGTAAKAALIIGTLKLAFEAFLKVVNSTGAGADKFKIAIAGLKGGLEQLWRSIATGNLKNLGKQMKDAADEARRYQRIVFEISDLDRRLKVEESRIGVELEKNRKIIESEVVSMDEKKVALKNIIELETELNALRKEISIKTYDNIVQKLVQMTGQEESLVKAYIEGDKALLDRVAMGQKYNELLEQEKKLTSGKTGIDNLDEHIKNVNAIRLQIANATEEEKKYAQLATALGIPVRELWVEATNAMIDVQEQLNAQMSISENAASNLNDTLQEQYNSTVQLKQEYVSLLDLYNKITKASQEIDDSDFVKELAKSFDDLTKTDAGFLLTDEAVKRGEKLAKEEFERIKDAELKEARDAEEKKLVLKRAGFDAAQTLANGYFEALSNRRNIDYEDEVSELDKLYEKKYALAGNDTKRKLKLDQEYNEEREKLDKEYVKKEQSLAIVEATIRGALAIVQAWAEEKYWYMALARSIAAAAETVTQISVINSQKLAKGGSGDDTGIIKGKSHRQGGERFLDHIEVEGGEAWGVLSKPATAKFGEKFHEIVSSFNRGEMPDIKPSVSNSVYVNNDGSNSRLDQMIAEQRRLNEKYGQEKQVTIVGSKKIIKTGNKIRIVG